MANVIVLDKDIINSVMEPDDTTEQVMYDFQIPANTLSTNSRLRINFELSRIVGAPLPESDLGCAPCRDTALVGAQTLSELATYFSPDQGAVASSAGHLAMNSVAFVGTEDSQSTIYQSSYVPQFSLGSPLPTIDDNPNYKVWRVRDGVYAQVAKVVTTTTDQFITPIFVVGSSDVPVYVLLPAITFGSNAPGGTYVYLIRKGIQLYLPSSKFLKIFSIYDNLFYGIAATGNQHIEKWNLLDTTAIVEDSSVLVDEGFSNPKSIHALGEYVYVIDHDGTLIKLDRNLDVIAKWETGISSARGLYIVNENLAYVLHGGLGISYFTMGDGQTTVVDSNITKTTTYAINDTTTFGIYFGFWFQKIGTNAGYFYVATDHDTRIMKIGPVLCP